MIHDWSKYCSDQSDQIDLLDVFSLRLGFILRQLHSSFANSFMPDRFGFGVRVCDGDELRTVWTAADGSVLDVISLILAVIWVSLSVIVTLSQDR